MGYLGTKPSNSPLTSELIPNSIITNAKINDVAATKLTGQVPDANAPSGSVIQVVQAFSDQGQGTTSSSFTKHTGLTLSITPRATNSKILVMYTAFGYVNGNGNHLCTTIYRNSTNLGANHGFGNFYSASSGYTEHYASGHFLDSPNSTSATEYAVYFKILGSGYSVTLGDGERRSVITAMEIAA